jgi:hypothetical protein
MFVNPCIIVQFIQKKVQRDATVYQNLLFHIYMKLTLVCICVVRLLFVLFYVLFVCKCVLPPGDNPIAVNKYIISCFGRHTAHHQEPKTALVASGFAYTSKVVGRVVAGRCRALPD